MKKSSIPLGVLDFFCGIGYNTFVKWESVAKKMKTVLITGASGGIGSGIARAFADGNHRLCLHANKNSSASSALADELKKQGTDAAVFTADLANEDDIARMFREIKAFAGDIDILVNNAGASLIKPLNDTSAEEWDALFAVNTRAAFLCAREASRGMIAKQNGRIINISSMWGVCGASCEVAYSASKAALIGFTKALAKELALSHITVNCVCPGVIDTPMNACLTGEDKQALIDETPLGRLGTPADIARAVRFFASDNADFVTGQVLTVDGGFIL